MGEPLSHEHSIAYLLSFTSTSLKPPLQLRSYIQFCLCFSNTTYLTVLQVRLFLEYCDRGCLRDALVGFAFMGPGGLNYKAVLDTALDIVSG